MRAWRLVLVSAVFCALGLLFFFWHKDSSTNAIINSVPVPQKQAQEVRYVQGPDPSVFETFVYDPTQATLRVEGSCSDVFYTVLIYPKTIDYRTSPLDAKYNTALPCPTSKKYVRDIDLSSLPLVAGESYYSIRAEQGARGQWYDAQ